MAGTRLALGRHHQFVQYGTFAGQVFAVTRGSAAALQCQQLFFQRLEAGQAHPHTGNLLLDQGVHPRTVGRRVVHQPQQLGHIGQ